MNNLITFINRTNNQTQIISLLKHNDIFDFVRHYLMEYHDVDFTGTEFIDEQNILSIRELQSLVTEAISASIN